MVNVSFLGEDAASALVQHIEKRLSVTQTIPQSPDTNTVILYIGADTSSYMQGGIYKYDGNNWILINNNVKQLSLTQEEYDLLPTSVQNNGTEYFVTNGVGPFENNIIQGYYNTTDGKFYRDSSFTIEITGNSQIIYIDLLTDKTYRYDSVNIEYILIGGSSYENKPAQENGTDLSLVTTGEKYEWNKQVDWNQSNDTKKDFIKNKPNLSTKADLVNGKVPSSQLPSYVDDVIEGYYKQTDGKFYKESTYETEITGETGKIYVDLATDNSYRWSGSAFVKINDVDVTAKADKVSNATNNNFAALDANGNLKDSGHKHSDYLTQHQDISGKADKVSGATSGNVATLDANGNLVDSNKTLGKSVPSDAVFTDTNNAVAQTKTTGNSDYEVLFSGTADNTTRTEGARKNNNLKFNPSTGNLQATQLNGVTIGSSPKFTDTTYESKSASSGGTAVSLCTTGEKYTWNGKADKAVPSASGNVATLDANGNLADSGKTLGISVPSNAVFTDSGHAILNSGGTTLTQRNILQFVGSQVAVLDKDNKTVINFNYPTLDAICDTWGANKNYKIGDLVIDYNNGNLYRCANNHTSVADTPPSVSIGNRWWRIHLTDELIGIKDRTTIVAPSYNSNTAYEVGDTFYYVNPANFLDPGCIYKVKVACTNITPPNTTYYEPVTVMSQTNVIPVNPTSAQISAFSTGAMWITT